MYQTYTLRDWAIFVQSYRPADPGRALWGRRRRITTSGCCGGRVSSIAGDTAAIIPKSMDIEFAKGGDKAADTKLYLERADWLNREVSKLVLGSTAGTEAIAGGHAVGKEHRQVEEDVERYDAGLISTSITRQIIPAMIDFTFGPPTDGKYPEVRIGRPDEVPLQVLIPAITGLAAAGDEVQGDRDPRPAWAWASRRATTRYSAGAAPAPENPEEAQYIPPLRDTPANNPLATQSERVTRWLGHLVARHVEAKPDLIAVMTERLAAEASHALGGMTDRIRTEFEAAADMNDLARRLSKLDLDADEFAEAMTRGIALAELVGQAALVQQLSSARH